MLAKMKRFIDIGANLTDGMYSGIYYTNKKHEEDLKQVLERSWSAGLQKIIITGGSLEDSRSTLTLAESDSRLYTTVGCHPTRCSEFLEEPQKYLENLNDLAQSSSKVVAIGECGLDYDRLEFCPKEVQKRFFEKQIALSKNLDLPLFLHCRNAADDLYSILSEYSNLRGVVHSFDGTLAEAQKFIDLGYYIGLNGCSLKTNDNLQTVAALPTSKILLETDCPWCEIKASHAGFKFIAKDEVKSVKKEKWSGNCMVKGRNEPRTITQVLNIVAAVKKVDEVELSEIVYHNTCELFFNK